MKILKLTLHRAAFEVMVTGEKTEEFRVPSRWIKSRVNPNKTYDAVEFTNGYGSDKPRFLAEYKGYRQLTEGCQIIYSTGFRIALQRGDYAIQLGRVLEIHNWDNHGNT